MSRLSVSQRHKILPRAVDTAKFGNSGHRKMGRLAYDVLVADPALATGAAMGTGC